MGGPSQFDIAQTLPYYTLKHSVTQNVYIVDVHRHTLVLPVVSRRTTLVIFGPYGDPLKGASIDSGQ